VPAVDFMGAVRAADRLAGPSPLLVLAAAAALLVLSILTQEVRHAHR
jgi:hypothetical protein